MADSVGVRIVRKIAAREGIDPSMLDPPLYDVIDPEALDAVFESVAGTDRAHGQVQFEYAGYAVTVSADYAVTVDSSEPRMGARPPTERSHEPEPVD